MKAAVGHEFTQPLSIEDVPMPEPGDGQVLVRIEACGLCHTDIHAAHGDWPIKPTLPLIPGHEGVGLVEALGPGAGEEIGVGDGVAIPWLGPSQLCAIFGVGDLGHLAVQYAKIQGAKLGGADAAIARNKSPRVVLTV
jgi:D-arabinose 1-dehydrogenase-like Zn-dependent alcohol dehydrogenase